MLAAVAADAYSWVGVIGGILGVIGVVGAAVAVLRSTIATNTIRLLQANNAALHDQNSQQAGEISTLTAKLEKQDQQIEVLKEMVSGARRLQAIESKVDQVLQAVGTASGGPQ